MFPAVSTLKVRIPDVVVVVVGNTLGSVRVMGAETIGAVNAT
jgi:hypothetical protein